MFWRGFDLGDLPPPCKKGQLKACGFLGMGPQITLLAKRTEFTIYIGGKQKKKLGVRREKHGFWRFEVDFLENKLIVFFYTI